MRAEAVAPCTVGNFGPGFDVFSMALARRGDRVVLESAAADELRVEGPGAQRLPTEWKRNVVGAVIDHLRERTGRREPLRVLVEKGMPPGSGLGSSASSSAAAVLAFLRYHQLSLQAAAALEAGGVGEAVATGGAHYDDVAAALYGGLTMVGGQGADAVVRLRPPPLHLVVARPEVDLPTREMRQLIPSALPRADVVGNLSNVARIVHACHTQDAARLCRALDDHISRPYRAPKVPGYAEARAAAMDAGATGFLLCGSGPSMLAALPGDADPAPVQQALIATFKSLDVAAEVFLSRPAEEVDDPALPLH